MVKIVIFIALFSFATANPFQRWITPSKSLSQVDLDGKIVGGYGTTIDQFPYQVSLRSFGRHYCGGSIYSSKIVLSAAHCLVDGPSDGLGVVAGSTFRSDGAQGIPIKKYVLHPEYEKETWYDYDVAIILLEQELEFGRFVQPISLTAANKEIKVGLKAYVSGWGTLSYMGGLADQLQVVSVMTIDRKTCTEKYAKVGDEITERMICAGEEFGGKDACQGDSGGPLMMENRLIGIVSFGEDCAKAAYPGVYTNVALMRDYIEKTVLELTKV